MTNDRQPLLGVYSVIPDDGGGDHWVKIGRAVRRPDGRGFDVTLQVLPLDARLVVCEAMSEEAYEPEEVSLADQVEAFERAAITRCLVETGGNIGAALDRLKIPRRTLNEKMARLGIDRRRLKMALEQELAGKIENAQRHPLLNAKQIERVQSIGHEVAKTEP
jgi:Bacterial regulatory protein, Fis family